MLPNKENFIYKFNSFLSFKTKYPLINMILNGGIWVKKIKLLKYLPIINKVCNYMIKYCSYHYTREEAKQKKIIDEIKDVNILDLIKKFYTIFKTLRPLVKRYDNINLEKGFNNLENESYLSNFCIDTNETNYEMVIAAI